MKNLSGLSRKEIEGDDVGSLTNYEVNLLQAELRSRDEFLNAENFTAGEVEILESSGFEINYIKNEFEGVGEIVVDRRTGEELSKKTVYDLLVTLNDVRNS